MHSRASFHLCVCLKFCPSCSFDHHSYLVISAIIAVIGSHLNIHVVDLLIGLNICDQERLLGIAVGANFSFFVGFLLDYYFHFRVLDHPGFPLGTCLNYFEP
jgi:hypothetical protein